MEDFKSPPLSGPESAIADDSLTVFDMALILALRWRLVTGGSLLIGIVAFGATYLVTPVFTARTTFLPPQQQQSSAASALASLGALSGLAGAAGGLKSPADQYVALMQSVTVEDRIIDKFGLMEKFDTEYRIVARKNLEQSVRIIAGKKDGLIAVETDSTVPQLAADIANAYVTELRRLTAELALTEAQQRRAFFEQQVKQTQNALASAQHQLQTSGFNAGAAKAEPKAAAEAYARLRAEFTSAEVRLQTLRATLTDTSPEVGRELTLLQALRSQLAKAESAAPVNEDTDYISRYREYKYQETLFELFSKQYELARLDESREGALIQVIDPATPPERKSKPKRAITAITATLLGAIALIAWVLGKAMWRRSGNSTSRKERKNRLAAELGA